MGMQTISRLNAADTAANAARMLLKAATTPEAEDAALKVYYAAKAELYRAYKAHIATYK
jgi:hypothetical protein